MADETASVDTVDAYRCLECGHVTEEPAEGSLYECSRCGQMFTQETSADGCSNRCPTCNIFGAKIAEDACPECNEGELEQVRAVLDAEEDALIVIDGDGDPAEALAEAKAERASGEARKRERIDRLAAYEEALKERALAVPPTPIGDVKVGDSLVLNTGSAAAPKYELYRVIDLRQWGHDKETGRRSVSTRRFDPHGEFWSLSLSFAFKADDGVRVVALTDQETEALRD